ncbi:hypothetical protein HDU67_000256, partial [Dinochytrium kinnereticum]
MSLSTCIALNGTTACPQWAQSIQPLKISSLVAYLPYLTPPGTPSLTTVETFDTTITSLPLTSFWGTRMGCPGLTPNPQTVYPLRFAESFTCGSVVSNVVKGTVGADDGCVDPSKVPALPSLCRETCEGFLESLKKALGDVRVCGGTPTEGQSRERAVYLAVIGGVCQGLRSVSEPVPVGSSKCVESTFRDFVSC